MRPDRSRSRHLVGRDDEVAALVGLAEDPAVRLVLVPGEAGVGKTRLLTEAAGLLGERGWRCLVGHCLDLGEGALPYLPFAEVARAAGATGVAEGSRGPDGEAVDRQEVLGSVHALLDELAAEAPLLVVVEDAHWADTSTRDLLTHLLTRPFAGRVLLVATYRSDELHRRHPLRRQVAEWVRRPGVERLPLEPLATGAVRVMAEELVGAALGDDDVDRIAQRAQGNAFYVEELAAAYVAGDRDLPDDLAELLLVRLERLDDRARALVRVASVAGQRVRHDLLAAVAGLDETALDAALRDAIDAHVLVRVGEEEYGFRHALLGEAAYDDLLPGERSRLHTAYGDAVRALRGAAGAPELARHALASHDLPTALAASIEAAELAMAVGGPEEASRHLRTALDLHARAADGADVPSEPELVLRAVEALVAAGRPERADTLVRAHLDRLTEQAPDRERVLLLVAHLEVMRATEAVAHPVEQSGEALELVGTEPSPLRARVLAAHALSLIWEDRHDEVRPVAEEALELADRLGLTRVASDASLALAWVAQRQGGADDAVADVERIVAEARARADVLGEMRGLARLGFMEAERGRLAEARTHFTGSARAGTDAGRPWSTHAVMGRTFAGSMSFMQGQWQQALDDVAHGEQDPPPTPRALLDSVVLLVASGRGETERLAMLPRLRARFAQEGVIGVMSGHSAIRLHARRDGAAAAVAAYDDVVAALAPTWGDRFDAIVRLAGLALEALADAARRAPTDDRDGLRREADRLVADARRVEEGWRSDGWTPGVEGRAWVVRVQAERLRLDWQLGDEVDLAVLEQTWREAADLFDVLGWVEEAARSRARLGAVLRAAGRGEEARAELRAAREVAVRLGALPLLEEVGERDPSADLLTSREQEILALVADGRSNGEIGTRLFISAKTVSVHVSNLMAKLGAGSRTEAVSLARRAGLLAD